MFLSLEARSHGLHSLLSDELLKDRDFYLKTIGSTKVSNAHTNSTPQESLGFD